MSHTGAYIQDTSIARQRGVTVHELEKIAVDTRQARRQLGMQVVLGSLIELVEHRLVWNIAGITETAGLAYHYIVTHGFGQARKQKTLSVQYFN